jgi:hypothetical protein
VDWRASASDRGIVLSTTSGDRSAPVDVSITAAAPADGESTLTIDAPATSAGRIRVPVRVRTIAAGAAPVGSIDAPAEGTAVPRSFDVSGWALDDVGVKSIVVAREPAAGERAGADGFIRLSAPFEPSGLRPDVEKVFPDLPRADRAAWGVRVTLPPQISGAVRLHVLVTDVEGHVKDLGPRAVQVR